MSMKICDLRTKIDHGRMFFVEKGTLKDPGYDKLHWVQAVVGDADMLELYCELKGFNYTNQTVVRINRNKTL